MNIIVATAELTPLAKAGGMADVTAALSIEWQKFGQNPIVIMPKYSSIDTSEFEDTGLVLYVKMSWWTEYARLLYGKIPGTDVPVYLIENDEYFNRDGIYGDPEEYEDNDRRFIFFSRAIFEAAKALNFAPDIIHAHDYHTAFTMAFLKSHYKYDSLFSRTAGVFTIHNLAYQGWFDPDRALEFAGFSKDEFYPGSWLEMNQAVNAMKIGIMFADKITTVSPNYSKEIRDPYYGEGLQDILNLRGADLIGVLNGVNYKEWDPETDHFLFHNYDKNNLEQKWWNKADFLKSWGLTDEDDLNKPLIGCVTRLTEQKGIDLIREKLEQMIESNLFRFILLGSGERQYEDYFRYLELKYPKNALLYIGYNTELSHRIMAASDYFLMPSRFEPCGLTQMYSLKYGTIPIVRETGGLADTVNEYTLEEAEGNGFSFINYNADDMEASIRRALSIYQKDPHWNLIRENAMNSDFPSSRTAMEYLKVFKWALGKIRH